MTKTIAQLWNGNLDPIQYFGRKNSEMKQLEPILYRLVEKLEENLSENQKKLFEKYNDRFNDYFSAATEQAFCDGFCVGAKIVVEALIGAEEVI